MSYLDKSLVKKPVHGSQPLRRGPFRNKRVYLDLKTRPKQLVNDIHNFGGTIEEFFSREVTTVITDAPLETLAFSAKSPGATAAAAAAAAAAASPAPSPAAAGVFGASPAAPPTAHSPAANILSPSPSAVLNNVWSPLSPTAANSTEERPKTKSRAEAIIERSRQQQQAQRGSASSVLASPPTTAAISNHSYELLDSAYRWGLQVWSLAKTQTWIANYKSGKAQGKQQKGGKESLIPPNPKGTVGTPTSQRQVVRHFNGPFLKYESLDLRFRPVYLEFRRFPQLTYSGKQGTSPFYSPPPTTHQPAPPAAALGGPPTTIAPPLQVPEGFAKGEKTGSPTKRVTVSTVSNPIKYKFRRIQDREVSVKANIKSARTVTTPKQNHPQEAQASPVQVATVLPVVDKKGRGGKVEKDKKPGYCELCEENFDLLMTHLEDEKHVSRIESASLWKELDTSISLANQLYPSDCDETPTLPHQPSNFNCDPIPI